MDTFYLGTHMTGWLARPDAPRLFVSHRRLARRPGIPRAATRWALDSGGFSELTLFGEWRTAPDTYAAAVRRYVDEIGMLDWAAPQDWMCEPHMLARTGKTIAEHQALTLENYLTLRTIAADLPFIPVLQGWSIDDYVRHAAMYERAGVDLAAEHTVGLGSVCRRQDTHEIARIAARLHGDGIALHGFGVKTEGVERYAWALRSADSLAWSYAGKFIKPCPQRAELVSCNNCWHWALEWRDRVVAAATGPQPAMQMELVL